MFAPRSLKCALSGWVLALILFGAGSPVFAYNDLIVDGDNLIIGGNADYGSIYVMNGGTLYIDESSDWLNEHTTGSIYVDSKSHIYIGSGNDSVNLLQNLGNSDGMMAENMSGETSRNRGSRLDAFVSIYVGPDPVRYGLETSRRVRKGLSGSGEVSLLQFHSTLAPTLDAAEVLANGPLNNNRVPAPPALLLFASAFAMTARFVRKYGK